MTKKVQIFISPDGRVNHVHDDQVTAQLSGLGPQTIARASRVDQFADLPESTQQILTARGYVPSSNVQEWFADMTPVHGDVYGPFASRGKALEHELQVLTATRAPNASVFRQEATCQQ